MMGEFIGELIFDIILEPIGASIRYVIFRLKGEKVNFKDLILREERENEIKNRSVAFLFIVVIVLIIMVYNFI